MATEEKAPARARDGHEPSDRSLLQRLQRGSQDAATLIYLRYAERLRALAQAERSPLLAPRVDVEDIVQSVFGSFFRGASRGYYDVPEGAELWKLFLVIALNKIRAKGIHHRAAKRDVRRTRGGDCLEAVDDPGLKDDDASLTFLKLTIDDALERFPPQHRQMVLLRVEGYEVAEIAEQTGHSKRTVERILQKCRQQLADLLQPEA
jgi:RNA polymerase sigma-70 factor (ECF subfamily)